ncbi:transposase [Arcanobacterium canis]
MCTDGLDHHQQENESDCLSAMSAGKQTPYSALLARIPPPVIVTTDEGRGALAAIKACWPDTRIQRCVVHVQHSIRTVTTTRPKIDQHKALYNLALNLTRVTSIDQAIAWQKPLAAFHGLYDTWLGEKTYRHAVTAAQVRQFARNNKTWWYTHHDTRRIVRTLNRYVKDGVLFTFLASNLPVTRPLSSTTNSLEGGVNSPLKAYVKAHRG